MIYLDPPDNIDDDVIGDEDDDPHQSGLDRRVLLDGRCELYVDAPSWLVLEKTPTLGIYKSENQLFGWLGWVLKYFHNIRDCRNVRGFCHALKS